MKAFRHLAVVAAHGPEPTVTMASSPVGEGRDGMKRRAPVIAREDGAGRLIFRSAGGPAVRYQRLVLSAAILVLVYMVVSAWASVVLDLAADAANATGLLAGMLASGLSYKAARVPRGREALGAP